ncbi:MAG: restriction endonuclease [Bacteroidetes bacterium]|nr:restriction endonuclease [Bacteroidota bacterium]MBU1113978.1 restriction endonuclease [Bacteroidota bacterium]MBU1800268.1 restriction endonuclease [Bacteroidota bacterium]
MKVEANNALFIKLGSKGRWQNECIEKNIIKLGFVSSLEIHKKSLNREWDSVKKYWLKEKKRKAEATKIANQIKYFYECDEDTLWITFIDKKLYWCFAESGVTILNDGNRIRKVKGKWSCKDIEGNVLFDENIGGAIAQVQRFQGTICKVSAKEQLLDIINLNKSNDLRNAENIFANLKGSIVPLIKNLHWKDFELLVDLIFTSSGWRRISVVGKAEKDVDLELMQNVTEEKAFVQIKSRSTMKEFNDYIQIYKREKQYNKMYFVVNNLSKDFSGWKDTNEIKLLDNEKLSLLVLNSGLVNWLFKKSK